MFLKQSFLLYILNCQSPFTLISQLCNTALHMTCLVLQLRILVLIEITVIKPLSPRAAIKILVIISYPMLTIVSLCICEIGNMPSTIISILKE